MPLPAASETRRDLSDKTREILSRIPDPDLRRDVEALVTAALEALAALARIHLPQDEVDDSGASRDAGSKHVELAPYVLGALAAINELTDFVLATFRPPAEPTVEPSADDFDLEFDLVDGPTGEGSRLTGDRTAGRPELTPREQVADVAHALGSMLRSRIASLAPRLRHVLAQNDDWPLLAELDDYQHGLTKGVQGFLFGVLGVFNDTARREEILPEYRSAVREAVDLRAALTDLAYHIGRFNAAISGAQQAELVPLVVGVSDRLTRFASRPEYRTMRSEDKRAVIEFRRTLYGLRHGKGAIPVLQLRQAVEGFAKFLDAMHSINLREVLVLHDRQRLAEAGAQLAESERLVRSDPAGARGRLQATVRLLSSVMGRHPDLDQALRKLGSSGIGSDLGSELARWRSLVEATASVVG